MISIEQALATDSSAPLQATCLDESGWQVRRYCPDPSKVMILSPMGRWLFDSEELVAAVQAVSGITP